jgi:hypothetical protein
MQLFEDCACSMTVDVIEHFGGHVPITVSTELAPDSARRCCGL